MPNLTQTAKRAAYLSYQTACRALWRLKGGRTIRLFGTSVTVDPATDFPKYRRYQLPSGKPTDHIVQYADFVQLMSIARYLSEIEEPPTIVDVGAYEGAYAVILGKLAASKGGRVLAIEPNSRSFRKLQSNVAKNRLESSVLCIHAAVGEQRGRANLSLDGSQSGVSERAPWQAGCEGEESEIVSLSELLPAERHITKVHLLIIDVEGAELPVLRGYPWDEVPMDRIYCELHPYAWPSFGYTKEEMFSFLEDKGFRPLDMYLGQPGPRIGDGYVGPTLLMRQGKA